MAPAPTAGVEEDGGPPDGVVDGVPAPASAGPVMVKESAKAAKILGVERTQLGLPNREVRHTIEARHMVAGDSNDTFCDAVLEFVAKQEARH